MKKIKSLFLALLGAIALVGVAGCSDDSEPYVRSNEDKLKIERLRRDNIPVLDFYAEGAQLVRPLDAHNQYVFKIVPAEGATYTFEMAELGQVIHLSGYTVYRSPSDKAFYRVETVVDFSEAPENRYGSGMSGIWVYKPFETDNEYYSITSTDPGRLTVTVKPNTGQYDIVSTFLVGRSYYDHSSINMSTGRSPKYSAFNTVVLQQAPAGRDAYDGLDDYILSLDAASNAFHNWLTVQLLGIPPIELMP